MTEENCKYISPTSMCVVQKNTKCKASSNWKNCRIYKTAFTGIDKDVEIMGNVKIGEKVRIKSGAKIYPNVTIGNNVSIGHYAIIYEGSVLNDDTSIPDFGRTYIGVDGITILIHAEVDIVEISKK